MAKATLIIRPLAAGEEPLFDSMPDPAPQLRQVSYAKGVADGGYRPEHTWVALRSGQLIARAAWLRPPGAVGEPWLERFDLIAEPEVGVALLHAAHEALGGPKTYYAAMPASWRDHPATRAAVEPPMAAARLAGLVEREERLRFAWAGKAAPMPSPPFTFRPAADAAEISDLVARIAHPGLLTGAETARAIAGVDLARNPTDWLGCSPQTWRIALADGEPAGLAAPAGDACYPMIAYLGVLDERARAGLIADSLTSLVAGGALEVIADVDAGRPAVISDLNRFGFTPLRSRVRFAPA